MYYFYLIKLHAQRTLPSSGDPAVQNAYQLDCEKRQTYAFIHGLRPNISTAVQLQAPRTVERAIEIANTMYFTFKSKDDTDDAHINFTGRHYHGWHSMSCSHRSQVLLLALCAVVTEDTVSLHTTGLWYYILDLLGEHIPIRVNIKRVQTQLNIQVLHVAVEGRKYTTTAVVQPIANMYHDRIFSQFAKGRTSYLGRRNAFVHQRPPTNAVNSRPAGFFGSRRENNRQISPRFQIHNPQMSRNFQHSS